MSNAHSSVIGCSGAMPPAMSDRKTTFSVGHRIPSGTGGTKIPKETESFRKA